MGQVTSISHKDDNFNDYIRCLVQLEQDISTLDGINQKDELSFMDEIKIITMYERITTNMSIASSLTRILDMLQEDQRKIYNHTNILLEKSVKVVERFKSKHV